MINSTEKTKQILNYLSKNPFSTTRQIAENSSNIKINYNTTKKILIQLAHDNVAKLLGYYFIIPKLNKEIPLLCKIIDDDKFLTPKFRKLNFVRHFYGSESQFQQLAVACILAFHLQIKIRKAELKKSKKSVTITTKKMKTIRNEFKKYLKKFDADKNLTVDNYNDFLFTHIINKFHSNQSYFKELRVHETSFKNKLNILSALFRTDSVRTVAGNRTNKNIRKIIKPITKFNLNPDLARIWFHIQVNERTINDRSVDKLASKVFFGWMWRLVLSNKTKDDGTPMTQNEIKRYRKNWKKEFRKIFKQDISGFINIKSFDNA